MLDEQGEAIEGRVAGTKLPAPLAAQAERRALERSQRKGKNPDKRSLQAAHYAMSFTTLAAELLGKAEVMKRYRYRWQMELAFKRLRQLLKEWHLPHQDSDAARGWIHANFWSPGSWRHSSEMLGIFPFGPRNPAPGAARSRL